ncbi:MAG: excinuclease ABC subunit UvrC [Chloroflexi bacterium]|nr:excinuclease ABC subunit UvrC [Chloroflexota bacterium]
MCGVAGRSRVGAVREPPLFGWREPPVAVGRRLVEQTKIDKLLAALPLRPGVYLFRNNAGEIIYVGKAISLRNRVRSYFRGNGQTIKVRKMVAQIEDFEFIVTDSELEALVLECNLIKKHHPRYNVRLRDDKHYPYIKVSLDEEWPRVYITRRIANDGARYFGPYTDSRSVAKTLDLLNKLFPYRTCNLVIDGTAKRPCLNYHIKRCLGPCIGAVARDDYMAVIRELCLFLEGKQEEILKQMRRRMLEASDNLEFERAAFLRDQIHAVEKVTERQKVVSTALKDEDVVAFARNNGEACVQIFFIRGGKLIGREHFVLEGTHGEDAKSIMTSFVTQFYDGAAYIPPRILLQNEVDEAAIIQSWLRSKRGDKVSIQVPRKGEKRRLVDMVAENAIHVLEQMRVRWLADEAKTGAAIVELAEHLDLPKPPERIECYDISNIQGTSAVGAMVVFENGQPKNAEYRRFKIREVPQANDYAMLQEVLRRRFKRGLAQESKRGDGVGRADDASWRKMPDLVVIDGGKGQLSAAMEVLRELDLENALPTVALAKENEEIHTPNLPSPIVLPRTAQSLYLMQRVRDEAHRFAIAYHRKVRHKSAFGSSLDDVPGIGPIRRAALLRQFGTLRGIREATPEDIAAVAGMTKQLARRIKEYL